jgi:hypothetical protein
MTVPPCAIMTQLLQIATYHFATVTLESSTVARELIRPPHRHDC